MEAQTGFSKERGTVDGVFNLKMALAKRKEHGLGTWVAFIDLVKAFDSVPRDILWEVLAKFGVPDGMIRVIQALYMDIKIDTTIDGVQIDIQNKVGVKQGAKESPVLFNFVIQAAMEVAMAGSCHNLQFRTNLRTNGVSAGRTSSMHSSRKGIKLH